MHKIRQKTVFGYILDYFFTNSSGRWANSVFSYLSRSSSEIKKKFFFLFRSVFRASNFFAPPYSSQFSTASFDVFFRLFRRFLSTFFRRFSTFFDVFSIFFSLPFGAWSAKAAQKTHPTVQSRTSHWSSVRPSKSAHDDERLSIAAEPEKAGESRTDADGLSRPNPY
jgi:hypothetical protein